MIVVLVAASGAAWESSAMAALDRPGDIVVLKRCVDVDDLLATASSGQAEVAVVALDAPGLDARAVEHLRHHGVRTIAVTEMGPGRAEVAAERASRIAASALVDEQDSAALVDAVRRKDEAVDPPTVDDARPDDDATTLATQSEPAGTPGRVVTVWGPAGAPGRTTVACGLAAVLAKHTTTTLVDADPYGGAVAPALGVLDEVSGLLSASRHQSTLVELDLGSVRRRLDHRLGVVTGLPRSDRWSEVRRGTVEHVLDSARSWGHVVVDTGFSLEPDHLDRGGQPSRNQVTFEALESADDLVVVGTADPVGLARLARGLVDLGEVVGDRDLHVVINRMRSTLSWSERDVRSMVEGFAPHVALHFLPDDQAAVDRALVTGRTLTESAPDSGIVRALSNLATTVVGLDAAAPTGKVRRRRGVPIRRR